MQRRFEDMPDQMLMAESGARENISKQVSMLGVSRVIGGMESGMLIVIF